jgi:hypothetical protein
MPISRNCESNTFLVQCPAGVPTFLCCIAQVTHVTIAEKPPDRPWFMTGVHSVVYGQVYVDDFEKDFLAVSAEFYKVRALR